MQSLFLSCCQEAEQLVKYVEVKHPCLRIATADVLLQLPSLLIKSEARIELIKAQPGQEKEKKVKDNQL